MTDPMKPQQLYYAKAFFLPLFAGFLLAALLWDKLFHVRLLS